ncbi:hypothetical protein KP509_02G084900 [Ceratopteris richardii]|uniref:IMP-specific 5'-nucleotidase 1 n=1 Tax=Ceratopteris richardii TaxID=49495 RepID=A0A8T2VFU8_CERRI|nr:hypothetical protein KP509_02G084900 [Ceratopteris richardii]
MARAVLTPPLSSPSAGLSSSSLSGAFIPYGAYAPQQLACRPPASSPGSSSCIVCSSESSAGDERVSLITRLQEPILPTTSMVISAAPITPVVSSFSPSPSSSSSYPRSDCPPSLPSSSPSSSGQPSSAPSQASSIEYRPKWSMLLSTEALEDAQISRAGSVTDAHVLRRKGRLKEQDGLIEFIISMHATHSPTEVMGKLERWVREHFEDPRCSVLKRLVPSIGRFYSPLPLVQALHEYDQFSCLSRRKYVPPNFAEIRHVLNIAQVHAIAERLSLITFDADGTLYADGHHIERDNKMICHIIKLLQHGAHVAIVTAAGYPGEPQKFENRFAGLLAAFEDLCLPREITSLFHIMGGECNYLLEVNDQYRLEFVDDILWKSEDMLEWSNEDIHVLLTDAECALKSAAARLRVPVDIVRKPRAVGVIPKEPTIYEVLEEMALTVQVQLVGSKLPFCAFNGGKDVFVDVGNKSVGLGALMSYLRKQPSEVLHVGDRFTISGNDAATRSKCPILWVANPEETAFYTRMLLRDIYFACLTPYIE